MPIDAMFQRRGGNFAPTDAPKHYPADTRLAPTHTDIALTLQIQKRRAAGTVTHTITAKSGGTMPLILNAVDLTLCELSSPQGEISWDQTTDEIHVRWQDAWAAGESRQLAIHYEVVDPSSGLFFSSPSEAYPDAATYAATDHETERARHWLPTIDLPNVRATLAFHLTSDANHTILANGAFEGEELNDDGTKTAHWRLDYPCPSYLVCFAVGQFTRADDGEYNGIGMAYFGDHKATEENLIRSFGRTGEMLEWLTQKLDSPFPFPKYYQFALPGFGGAMENISLVSWDDIFVLDETFAKEWTWLVDQINIHEMAHSYFGDAIVCRDYAHAWLKESWATYIETCWLEDKRGDDEMHYDFFRNEHAYFDEADNSYKRPIVTNKFNSSWDMYDRHLYPGGAARLHMLRKWIGDDVFWAAVRDYVATYSNALVETADFRQVLENHCGRSLVQFFEQWIYSAGYPHLKVTFSWDDDNKLGTFKLVQKQVEDSKGKEPTFVLDMSVGWTIDGETYTQDFVFDQARHQLTIPMSAKPQMVRVDPQNKIVHKLSFNPGADYLVNQLTQAPDVIGRILAGRELAETAKGKNVAAIADAYANEPFWGVRQQWCASLGKVGNNHGIEALLRCLEHEEDPMVLESLMSACGKYRDQRLFDALLTKLEEGALPYRASMAAYVALGRYGDKAPTARMLEAAQTPTFASLPEQGALQGIAASRQAEYHEALKVLSTPGKASHRVRASALMQLGKLVKYMDEAAKASTIDHLIDALRDDNDRVRMSAARALFVAKASSARGALQQFIKTLPHQERVELEGRMSSLRGKDTAKLKAVEEELDEVKKKYRDLLERIEALESKS